MITKRLAELRDALTAVQREMVSAAEIQRAVALFDPSGRPAAPAW